MEKTRGACILRAGGSLRVNATGRVCIGVALAVGLGCQADPTPAGGGVEDPVSSSTPPSTTSTVPLSTATLVPDDAVLLNPERGFYQYVDLVTTQDLSGVRDEGSTLVFSYVRLDDYRQADLPQALLDDVERGLAAARLSGVKVIVRFAYNFGPWPDSEPDASKAWVLTHISQLAPLLQANADVIAVVQAGFIGAWGEWHSSTEGLLDDPDTRYEILESLLEAVPTDRAVQLRYPFYKEERYGGPIDASTAHDGSLASRIGHHNDCFLASETDLGTYPPGERETWQTWLSQENLYVPMGGETCAVYPALTDCTPALQDFERLRFTYINHDYHPDVVSGWTEGGCYEDIDRKLGYRLVATEVRWAEELQGGEVLPVTVSLTNTGWAAPINPRSVALVLEGPSRLTHPLAVDPRDWLPGEEQVLEAHIAIPVDLPPGTYELGLALPDADPALSEDPRYAIRLANVETWREGWNALASVEVRAGTP